MKNYGVLLGQRDTDYIAGTLPYRVLNPSGDWFSWNPKEEWQWILQKLDTMACVTFSALNVLETLYYFHTGTQKNFSDRFTAVMSGTTPQGNYLWKVADSIRKDGLVDETDYPPPPILTWENYYTPPPIEVINKAKEFLKSWTINYEFIPFDRESLLYHLKQSPIQVVIPGHAVMSFYTTEQITKYFDSYAPFIKEWQKDFVSALKYVMSPNQMQVQLYKQKSRPEIFYKDIDGQFVWIPSMEELDRLNQKGWLVSTTPIEQNEPIYFGRVAGK